jgi:hypothetical protein
VAITDITLKQITDAVLLKKLAAMSQFHSIPDRLLFKIAHHVTFCKIPDRWVAIYLIVENGLPIPVVEPPYDKFQR